MLFEPTTAAPFPVRLEADYPERLSRLSTLFRFILAIPVLVVLYLLGQGLIWVYWIGILVRGRPVRWLFEANVAILRFTLRAYAYFLLLTDRYPPFDGEWQVRYEVDYPERLSRWRLVIWKTVTVIPHAIVLGFVFLGVVVVVFLAWFAVLFTGRYPRGMHSFVSGWLRWVTRVWSYWMSLTDEFPSFSLSADVGPAYFSSYVISAIFGWLIVLAWVGVISVAIAWPGETKEVTVSYQQLLQDEPSRVVEVSDLQVMLLDADDPYVLVEGLYQPQVGYRFVLFRLLLHNATYGSGDLAVLVEEGHFRLSDSAGEGHDPVLVTVDGEAAPVEIEERGQAEVWAMFEVDEEAQPAELRYSPGFGFPRGFKQRVRFVLE